MENRNDDFDLIISSGLDKEAVYFYTNLIINGSCMHGKLLYQDSIIDKILLKASGSDVFFRVNMHNNEFITSCEGKIRFQEDKSFEMTSFFEEISKDGYAETTYYDTFRFADTFIERYTQDNSGNAYYGDIQLLDEVELKRLFTLHTEFKKYEAFLMEIINEKNAILLTREEDILNDEDEEEEEEISSPQRVLN